MGKLYAEIDDSLRSPVSDRCPVTDPQTAMMILVVGHRRRFFYQVIIWIGRVVRFESQPAIAATNALISGWMGSPRDAPMWGWNRLVM